MGTLTGNRFELEWPNVASQLNALLSGKRIPAHKREDVVQETGLRLFKMWDSVDPERPVWPLAVTICLNLLRDEARRGFDREVLGEIPDLPENNDVEHTGIARMEFARVCRAMATLSPAHRSVLLYEIGMAPPGNDDPAPAAAVPRLGDQATVGPTAAAVKMLRMRARRKLHSVLEAASASSVAALWKLRSTIEAVGQMVGGRSFQLNGISEMATAGAAFFAALALAGLPGAPWSEVPGADGTGSGVKGSVVSDTATTAASSGSALGSGTIDSTRRSGAGTSIGGSKVGHGGHRRNADDEGSFGVPLPGGGYVGGEAYVDVFGYGADIKNNGGQVPACVRGVSAGTGLVCDGEPPSSSKVRVKAKASTVAGDYEADVDSGA